ncbi:MAG: DUF4102 domain-containing protein, partial [Comamonadaceae bacterium]
MAKAATKALTATSVSSIKAQPGQRVELRDKQMPGLCLRVTDRGVKSWVLRYRSRHGGQPRYKIGDATRMTLVAARAEAARLKAEIADGNEPAAERKRVKEAVAAEPVRTVNELLDAYFAAGSSGLWKPKKKIKRPQTTAFEQRLADRHIRPRLGKKLKDELSRADVRALLRDMYIGDTENADEDMRRKPIGSQTNRVQAIIRQAYNWAMSEDLVTTNPALNIQSLHTEVKRRRIWTDDELARLWSACEAPNELRDEQGERVYVARSTAIAIQLCALLLQRRVEVSGMAVAELNLKERTWEIAPNRMKGGRAQMVPLPSKAVELIEEALALAQGEDEDAPAFVFPSPRDKGVPITAGALT